MLFPCTNIQTTLNLLQIMALSMVNLGMRFSSLHSMLKPTSFTCVNPSSNAKKVFEVPGIRCSSSSHDSAVVSTGNVSEEVSNGRRSGNYPPSMWDYDFFQSLSSDFKVRMIGFWGHFYNFVKFRMVEKCQFL